ncbi:ATP-dependent nuclease [Vibrio cholerae]|uniref:ATP-dependent nuclease n=1 Tax=Vibrio cholerae TaxID=666 RepID=UPI0030193797
MKIKKIRLEKFKSYSDITMECNDKFNIIVGENNIGKTTFFEAILLWKTMYEKLIKENGRKFYNSSTNNYLSYNDIFMVRMVDDSDIFHTSSDKSLSITLFVSNDDDTEVFELKIKLEKPTIKNSYFRLSIEDKYDEFVRFATEVESKNCSLKDAIFIYQTKPLSTITRDEPFYNNAQVAKKINIGKSHDVLRNKVLKTEDSSATKVSDKYLKLEERLKNVTKSSYKIRFKNKNRQDDEYIRITVEDDFDKELELSLMGSGFLQVVEIFSTLEYMDSSFDGAHIMLVDEPDSHIHSDLQSHLFDELKTIERIQLFVISHNDRLTSKANDGELFYVNSTVKEHGLLTHLNIEDYDQVKNDLAGILDSLDIDDDKPLIITEGKTDKIIIETAWAKLFNTEIPYEIIASGFDIDESKRSGSADSVMNAITYLSTLTDRITIGLFDNDRAGREKYKGLNKQIFSDYVDSENVRKHKVKNIFGVCLPVPSSRSIFITAGSVTQRYFAIEHYFENQILENHNMKGESILNTPVFEISGNKNSFSHAVSQLEKDDFENFTVLFDLIKETIDSVQG